MNKDQMALAIYALPFLFLATSIFFMWRNSQKQGPMAGCISGGITAGLLNGGIQFLLLAPLLVKGTDGPGGLIALILPVVTFGAGLILGVVVGFPLQLIKASRQQAITQLSPKAAELIRNSTQPNTQVANPIVIPLSPSDRKNWRDWARTK